VGLWRWLFGRGDKPALDELEEDGNRLLEVAYRDGKRHGPYRRFRRDGSLLEEGTYVDGERDGRFVIHGRDLRIEGTYRAGKLHGAYDVLRADGSVEEAREYDHGELVRGRWERRDELHKNWVRERGTLVHGRRDGVWEEFGPPRSGANGPLMKRSLYKDGVLDGRYETWFYLDNAREREGEYRAGRRVGHWTYRRHDGTTQAELDYEDGSIVRWRWLARDGRERALLPILDDDDLERWLALGDAWDQLTTEGPYGIQLAVDRWPAEQHARPLAWIDERIASEGCPRGWDPSTEWLRAMTDSEEPDPRTRYIDRIDLDHHALDAEQTRRLRRFAPQIVELGLVGCAVAPDLSALFDVPWPQLESLSLHECGPVEDVIEKLRASPLEDVSLTCEPLSAGVIEKLVNAPWFASLQALRLTVEDRAIVDALASLGMPELRELEIECYDLELTAEDIAALIEREQRPTLSILVLKSIIVKGDLPSRPGVEIELAR